MHTGITEAGSFITGSIKSSIGVGSLLMDGIGDTIRISLSDNPTQEIKIGNDDELNSPLQSIMHLHDSFCLIFDVRWQTLEVSQIFQISIPFLSFSKIRIQFSFFSQNKQNLH